MSSGFNTDIKVGEQVFHVQTEDRGPAHPVIDTWCIKVGGSCTASLRITARSTENPLNPS